MTSCQQNRLCSDKGAVQWGPTQEPMQALRTDWQMCLITILINRLSLWRITLAAQLGPRQ
jgi:hypothetical protein